MPPRKLYLENVRVGDEIPAMAKAPVERVQLARYAGATLDFNPAHVDEAWAKGAGMPSVYAPSPLGMGFLGQLVTDWARGARIQKFNVKFIKLIWPGDTLVCKGRVSDRYGQEGRYFIELDVWAENQKGELVLKGTATLQVYYSPEDENRQRQGQPPVQVNVPRESLHAQPAPEPPAKAAKASKPGKPAKAHKPAKAPKRPARKPAPKKAAKASKPAKKKGKK